MRICLDLRLLQHGVLLFAASIAFPAFACPLACGLDYSYRCNVLCGRNDGPSPEQVEREQAAERDQAALTKDIMRRFKDQRSKLWVTDPSDPGFKAVYAEYEKARRYRDGDMLFMSMLLIADNPLVALAQDNLVGRISTTYELDARSSKAFMQYAARLIRGGMNSSNVLSIVSADHYLDADAQTSGRASYGQYVFLADKAELAVWKKAHGIEDTPYPPEEPAYVPPPKKTPAEERAARDARRARVANERAEEKPWRDCLTENLPPTRPVTRDRDPELSAKARELCEPLLPAHLKWMKR